MGHHGKFAAARYKSERRWETHRDARVARFEKMVRASQARRAKRLRGPAGLTPHD